MVAGRQILKSDKNGEELVSIVIANASNPVTSRLFKERESEMKLGIDDDRPFFITL